MQKTTEWLLEEQIPSTGAGLMASLETTGGRPLATQDPVEYMKDLLSPVECHAHTIDRLSNLFTYGQAIDTISPSPRAVIHLMTAELTGDAPVKPHAASLITEAYLKMNNLAAAEISALAALKAGDTSAVVLKIAADTALTRGKTEAARELSTLAAAMNPGDPEASTLLAKAEARLTGPDAAIEILKKTVHQNPDFVPAWTAILDLTIEKGEPGETEKIYTSMPRQIARTHETLIRLAAARKMAGDHGGAIKALEDAARSIEKEKPGEKKTLNLIRLEMAGLKILVGDMEKAVTLLKTIAQNPLEDPETALKAAWAMYEAGFTKDAADLAARLQETRAGASTLLGRIAFGSNRDQEAFTHFQNAVEKDPADTTSILFMAMIALRNRQLGTALELAILAAQTRDQNSAKAWLLASDALRLSGNRDEAREALAQAAVTAQDDQTLRTEIAARQKILEGN